MSNTNVEVKKGATENSISLVRRFQKRVQEAGILPRVRSIRYSDRPLSDLKVKRAKLRKIKKQKEYETLKRLGKVVERKRRR
jgi:ribosomal protein S21